MVSDQGAPHGVFVKLRLPIRTITTARIEGDTRHRFAVTLLAGSRDYMNLRHPTPDRLQIRGRNNAVL
jgi:hypothetical protein